MVNKNMSAMAQKMKATKKLTDAERKKKQSKLSDSERKMKQSSNLSQMASKLKNKKKPVKPKGPLYGTVSPRPSRKK